MKIIYLGVWNFVGGEKEEEDDEERNVYSNPEETLGSLHFHSVLFLLRLDGNLECENLGKRGTSSFHPPHYNIMMLITKIMCDSSNRVTFLGASEQRRKLVTSPK